MDNRRRPSTAIQTSSQQQAPQTPPPPQSPRSGGVGSLFNRGRTASFVGRLSKRSSLQSPPSPQPTAAPPAPPPTRSFYEDEEDDVTAKSPRLTSEYFKRYELMTEFINLRNPSHCPLGVYVMPSSDNLNIWYGVIFVHKGYYRSGVFKFRMTIPESYPTHPPSVTFLTDMFHPLVDVQGNVSITQQFPTWRPYQDYIFHVLHYLKNMFKKVVLEGLVDKHCLNKEAYRLYRTDTNVFGKLAQQCAQLSITESYLFDHFPDNNMIRFSPLSEAKFDELKAHILNSAANK
ncbi:ubiquitin-conjugating enzyme/RWD-like protein [Syncephalastrum racemosum]|uniref:Ubiquitin-conjugating enzyme/RWD-like protein n=1 Tax=Syncephalastrum racemosum TaxID=13706 RepID=A0A1X2H698_SYNRA|nr:ubiquitin-conjugating enzyme/RWD-like protein [Syncephalastrum racemosum]